MPLVLAIFAVVAIAALLLAVRVASRPPRCPTCRIPAEGVSEDYPPGSPVVVGMTWRCTRCGGVVGRRYLLPLWD